MLQYILNRKDVSGILPYEYQYYNPFNADAGRNYSAKMAGLSLEFPVFFFRHHKAFEQYNYALQWNNDELDESFWNLFEFDLNTGIPEIISQGKNYHDYKIALDLLKEEGVKQEDIMFGGQPTQQDSLKLKLEPS
jgi:hypothetical protein